MPGPRTLAACLFLGLIAGAAWAADTPASEGVVVVRVSPGGAAAKAGLRPGDGLRRWERGSASGVLSSPFDLAEVELEQAPRGPVTLSGLRDGQPLTASLFPDDWGLETRPASSSAVDAEAWRLLVAARAEADRRNTAAAVATLEQALRAARAAGHAAVEAQLLTQLGAVLREADEYERAATALDEALAVRQRLGRDTLAAAAVVEPIARLAYARGIDSEAYVKQAEEAAALAERLAPESLTFARLLHALGWLQGPPKGGKGFERAFALVERLAPDSVLMARMLHARAFAGLPSLDTKLDQSAREVAILERLAPDSPEMVSALSLYATALRETGDVAGARRTHERALALVGRTAPGSVRQATVLNNLGVFHAARGDLAEAERYYQRALEIDERRRPGIFVAIRLYNLAEVALGARDFERAETYLLRALEELERQKEKGELIGRVLYSLGRVRRERKRPEEAAAALRRSLELLANYSPGQKAAAREQLAELLADQQRYDEAESLLLESLEEARKLRTYSASLGDRYQALGRLALRRGRDDDAERHLRTALDHHRRRQPGTTVHAEASHDLGVIARRRGRQEEARALFEEAVTALEAQAGRLGGSAEVRARFRAHFQSYYRDLEELLLELGRPEEAFETVERSRARGLLALLASRDLAFPDGVPAELEKERAHADKEHERIRRALAADDLEAAARETLTRELDQARRAQENVRARIRSSVPRQMAFRDPVPLDLEGVRKALEPGTLLIVYSLGPSAGRAYTVGPGTEEFAVVTLGMGADGLRDEVQRFRQAIHAGRGRLQRTAVTSRSERLTAVLLRPLSDRMRRARQMVIVPDGPLHLLPFAALHDPLSRRRYVVEAKPFIVASSATLYDTLTRSAPRGAAPTAVVGFGDPVYPSAGDRDAGSASATVARAFDRGLSLTPLPATRRELAALRSLSPQARLWLGAEATEERAKALGRDARIVHFACHGYLDEQFPLESGLALSMSAGPDAGENGLLQAWEVFESVRFDADLVTLSACQTGLGQDMGGEGLLGLTWAFQYAGARSVLATLWEVNDASTAELMRAFYRNVAAGVPAPEALRRAQVALLRNASTAPPYFWASFTLAGAGR